MGHEWNEMFSSEEAAFGGRINPDSDPPAVEPPDEYMVFARSAFEHRECRARAERELGGDVTTVPSADSDTAVWPCGHYGVRYWLVPVGGSA